MRGRCKIVDDPPVFLPNVSLPCFSNTKDQSAWRHYLSLFSYNTTSTYTLSKNHKIHASESPSNSLHITSCNSRGFRSDFLSVEHYLSSPKVINNISYSAPFYFLYLQFRYKCAPVAILYTILPAFLPILLNLPKFPPVC